MVILPYVFLGYFQREEATPEESYRRMIEDFIASLEVAR